MTRFNSLGTATVVNAMRSISALGLVLTLCGSADAATVHHFRAHHHHQVISRSANSFAFEPAQAPVRDHTPGYDEAPSGHEASTYGGATLLPDD
jgi:Fe2+ or Zn2+ uptake regulation protein